MEITVKIYENAELREVKAQSGVLISELLDMKDIHIDYPCAKKCKCLKCLVKAEGEITPPTTEELELEPEQLDNSYRLACCTRLTGDSTVYVTSSDSKIVTAERKLNVDKYSKNPLYKKNGIAVDIGTTTIAINLIRNDGKVFSKSSKNPQTEFGADVISRIERQLAGEGEDLAKTVVNGINSLVNSVCIMANLPNSEIDYAVITGNTVMLHLLTKRDCKPLSASPFKAEYLGGDVYNAGDLGLFLLSDCSVYLPNCFSAFVGGDISTAILASEMMNSDKTSVLVDIGTNGEMALWHNSKLYCCSTAAGPAFEGVGIKCGMHGVEGAIDHVNVQNGNMEVSVIGNVKPKGICGSGVIDCISAMLKLEVLDETGRIDDENEDFESQIVDTDDDTLFLIKDDIGIYGKDIRAVQLAKSAICSGVVTLIKEVGLDFDDIETLYVAGGFGSFLDIKKAGDIGLIPKELVSKVKVIGNAALQGGCYVLLNSENVDTLKKITEEFSLVELDTSSVFMDSYVENMFFN